MKLLFVRHADPNYATDSLTERGKKEATLLGERLKKLSVQAIYVSPMGRAKETARLCASSFGLPFIEKAFLHEFNEVPIERPDGHPEPIPWDWKPSYLEKEARFLSAQDWMDVPLIAKSDIPNRAKWVYEEFDRILAEHGYVREGKHYKVVRPNNDTLLFVSHFGIETLLLSHLINASPILLWQGFVAPTSSLLYVESEEREEGIASWRANYGDLSHLEDADTNLNRNARFCGCFLNSDERHD